MGRAGALRRQHEGRAPQAEGLLQGRPAAAHQPGTLPRQARRQPPACAPSLKLRCQVSALTPGRRGVNPAHRRLQRLHLKPQVPQLILLPQHELGQLRQLLRVCRRPLIFLPGAGARPLLRCRAAKRAAATAAVTAAATAAQATWSGGVGTSSASESAGQGCFAAHTCNSSSQWQHIFCRPPWCS